MNLLAIGLTGRNISHPHPFPYGSFHRLKTRQKGGPPVSGAWARGQSDLLQIIALTLIDRAGGPGPAQF
jgi:hypothetical protein